MFNLRARNNIIVFCLFLFCTISTAGAAEFGFQSTAPRLSTLVIAADKNWLDFDITNVGKFSAGRSDIPVGAIEAGIFGEYQVAMPENKVVVGIEGYVYNDGTETMGYGHGIGVLGLAADVDGSEHDLYGFEGRVNGTSTHAGINYYGALGLSTFENNHFNGMIVGIQARIEVTSDGSTPLNEGMAFGFYAPAIVGGDTKYSFFGKDPMRLDNYLLMYDSTAANYGIIGKFTSGDLYITSDNGQVTFDDERVITTGEVSIKVFAQAAEPTLHGDDYFAFWKDTNDANKIYLIFRRGNGDHVKIQLQ